MNHTKKNENNTMIIIMIKSVHIKMPERALARALAFENDIQCSLTRHLPCTGRVATSELPSEEQALELRLEVSS